MKQMRPVGKFVEQHVRFTIKDFVALEDAGLSDGLREVSLAGSAGAEEQCTLERLQLNAQRGVPSPFQE